MLRVHMAYIPAYRKWQKRTRDNDNGWIWKREIKKYLEIIIVKCILILDRLHQQHEVPLCVSLRIQILTDDNRKFHENGTRYPEKNCQPPPHCISQFFFLIQPWIAPRNYYYISTTHTQQQQEQHKNKNNGEAAANDIVKEITKGHDDKFLLFILALE